MKNKTLIILFILLALLFINTITLATDNMKNAINSGTNAVVDGISNATEDVRNGVGAIESKVENGVNMLSNNINSDTSSIATNNDGGYTAVRTDSTITNDDTTRMVWTWTILAIAAVVIVGLVWYYANQTHDNNHV